MSETKTPQDKFIDMLIDRAFWILKNAKEEEDQIGRMFMATSAHILMGIAMLFDPTTPSSYKEEVIEFLVDNEFKVKAIIEKAMAQDN